MNKLNSDKVFYDSDWFTPTHDENIRQRFIIAFPDWKVYLMEVVYQEPYWYGHVRVAGEIVLHMNYALDNRFNVKAGLEARLITHLDAPPDTSEPKEINTKPPAEVWIKLNIDSIIKESP